jgi:hypothetical protein
MHVATTKAATISVAVAITFVTAATPAAQGSRSATPLEARAILRAVQVYQLACRGCTWRVSHVRISTVDRHFAIADERGTRGGQPLQGARVLLWHGVSMWAVISEGSDPGIGCGFVRAAVRKDLFGTSWCP